MPIAWKFSFREGTAEELFDKSATIHELALEVLLATGGQIEILNVLNTNITGQFVNGLDDTKLRELKYRNIWRFVERGRHGSKTVSAEKT